MVDQLFSLQLAEDFRKTYLFLYNMFQFVGFVFILIIFAINYIKEGPDSIKGSYLAVGRVMKFLHFMQLLEIIHPLLGYTAGSPIMPAIQLFGRMFMIFIMIDAEPRMHSDPAVFYLFLVYTIVEVIRYSYYMFHVFRYNIAFLTWIRYTAWVVLYPFGFFQEGVIIFRNISYFEDSGQFSLALPNPFNVSFYLPNLLRLYLLIGFFPALYFMMSHMYRQRAKILGKKKSE